MDAVLTLAGVVLIAVAVRDIFETLFHPAGRGVLSHGLVRIVSSVARWRSDAGTSSSVAGPLGYITVLATWTTMLAFGWALIILPHMPEGFAFDPGLTPAEHGSLGDALYVSLVNLTSLGYGDISPAAWGLRILGPVETLFGLGLLTASISWLISIYGTLSRRDSFTHEIDLVRQAEEALAEKLVDAEPQLLERMLTSFADQLIVTRRDLIHFPITHYFQPEKDEPALSEMLPFLRRLAAEASEPGRPHALRVRAEMLRLALDDFAHTVRGRLHNDGEPDRPRAGAG